jgi:hypothetical protein
MSDSWREHSLKEIDRLYRSIRAAQPETVTDDQIMRMISRDHYPYGWRGGWAYKAWLTAIREYKAAITRGGPDRTVQGPLFPN